MPRGKSPAPIIKVYWWVVELRQRLKRRRETVSVKRDRKENETSRRYMETGMWYLKRMFRLPWTAKITNTEVSNNKK